MLNISSVVESYMIDTANECLSTQKNAILGVIHKLEKDLVKLKNSHKHDPPLLRIASD